MKAQLRELERRLDREPGNLGLRVQVAGLMHQSGRTGEAVELYRSVALAYRDQGRHRQAIAVCHSILDIAPDDASCRALLASMAIPDEPTPPPARGTSFDRSPTADPAKTPTPKRRSSVEPTPLPTAVPYHVADPTSQRVREPVVEGETTRPGGDPEPRPALSGLAEAARHITGLIAGADASGPHADDDLAAELDTRKRPRIASDELAKIAAPPPTVPIQRLDSEDLETGSSERPASAESSLDHVILTPPPDGEEEPTSPRDLPGGRARDTSRTILDGAFFAPLPPDRRAQILARFARRTIGPNTVLVRRGEIGNALYIVVRGRLEQRTEPKATPQPIEAGEYVGELELLSRAPATAQLVAAVESELLVLAAKDFFEIAGAYPALWAELKARSDRRRG